MSLIKWNTAQVQGAIAGSLLLVSPALADQGGILRVLPPIAGAGMLLTLPSRTHSREEDDDFFAYLKAGWDAFTQGAVTEAKQILADTAPPQVNRWVDSIATTFSDPLDLFKRLHEKSFLLVAETGGGKTWLMHQSVLFATDTRDQFLVLDKSYGKRGMDWWRLPVGKQVFLFGEDNVENLPDLLYSAYCERNRRKKAIEQAAQAGRDIPSFPRYRLYITEWNQTQASYAQLRAAALEGLDKDEEPPALPSPDKLDFWKDELLFDGHGYNMFLGLDVQSAAVGRTNIDKSQQSQVNWLLMGSTAINTTEVGKLIPNAKDWVSRVQAARSLPGMQRAGIAIVDGKPYLYNPVPYGDGLMLPEETQQLNEVEQWLELRKPDVISIMSNQENASASGIFDQIKLDFPKGYANRRSDNPYWLALKEFVVQYKNQGV
jgi:hypothetical protein